MEEKIKWENQCEWKGEGGKKIYDGKINKMWRETGRAIDWNDKK